MKQRLLLLPANKSQREILHKTLQEIKLSRKSMNRPIMNDNFQDFPDVKQNNKADWRKKKNEYLQIGTTNPIFNNINQ